MRQKFILLMHVFLASAMTSAIAQTFSSDKVYTIVCKPDFNTFMQDYGTGTLLLGAESRATLWTFESTGNPDCYYVKNVVTGNYIQSCPDSEVAATMGTTPVEYYIKGDVSGGQAGENFFRMTSTDRTPHDFSAGTIGLNRAGDNTKVQGFASVAGANQWSVWCIREVEMVQQASLSSPFTGTEVQEGKVYLYTVESGKWLQNNNRFNADLTAQYWTTRAELGEWGLDLNLTALGDGGYQIDPGFINNHSINDFNLYMDTTQPVTSWKFTPKNVAGVSNAYTIEAEKATLGSDVNGYLHGANLGATTWQVVTLEERIQYAQDNTSATNPIDVTFLVNNPDLSSNNERTAWVITKDGGTEVWNNASRYNRHCQVQGSASVDISQANIEVPNGIYQVRFTSFYAPTGLANLNINDYNAYKTNGDAAVCCDKVRGQARGAIENNSRRLCRKFDNVPCHIRHLSDVTLQAYVTVNKADERFGVVPLFDVVDFFDGIGVSGVAANTPYGVGGVEDDTSLAHYFYSFLNVFFLFHKGLPFKNERASIRFFPASCKDLISSHSSLVDTSNL